MKNGIVISGDDAMIEIIYKGNIYYCIIDKEDISKVSWIKGTWHMCVNRSGHIDGVKTKIQAGHIRKQVWLHNYILCKDNPNNIIDHIDHNPLNNRKSNLREVTPTENSQNITVQLSKSRTRYRNVTIERGRYRVRINGKSYGNFDSFEEAKIVADKEGEKVFPLTSKKNGKIFINNE